MIYAKLLLLTLIRSSKILSLKSIFKWAKRVFWVRQIVGIFIILNNYESRYHYRNSIFNLYCNFLESIIFAVLFFNDDFGSCLLTLNLDLGIAKVFAFSPNKNAESWLPLFRNGGWFEITSWEEFRDLFDSLNIISRILTPFYCFVFEAS